mgnify:CR=1 FL=1
MKNNILIQPVLSEKSYAKANSENKYTFIVSLDATKIDIKNEVEKQFKVKVTDVNIILKPGKMKKDWVKFKMHRRADMKKAVVQLKKGDKIDELLNV